MHPNPEFLILLEVCTKISNETLNFILAMWMKFIKVAVYFDKSVFPFSCFNSFPS